MKTLTCQRPKCGHTWKPEVARPKVCPRCKSYDYATPPKQPKQPRRKP